MKISFVDLETSGLDPRTDEIIEAAVVILENGVITDTYAKRYVPAGRVGAKAAKVNGYNKDLWEASGAKPMTEEDARTVADYLCRGGIIGGANPAFDQGFLKATFERLRLEFPGTAPDAPKWWPSHKELTHRLVDIQSLAMPLVCLGLIKNTSLHEVAKFFGLGDVVHSALSDATQAAHAFTHLVDGYTEALSAQLKVAE